MAKLHRRGPAIIEAAINGATSKEVNPNVPRSAAEIATDAIASIEAGAAIIHNDVDVYGVSGEEAATAYLEAWRPAFAAHPDALVYSTINFGGDRTPSNVELICEAVALCERHGVAVATPDQAAEILDLPRGGYCNKKSR